MRWLGWGVLYLCLHFLFYVTILRYLRLFSRESAIFLYHVLSALAVGGALVWIMAATQSHRGIVPVVGAMSLHGVYSLSFLELWSLAQGSFSVNILNLFYTAGARNPGGILLELEGIGASKKRSRIESLERLGLLRRRGQRLGLTIMGRGAATALWIVAWTVNSKKVDW